jgi:hypothetical protein
MQASEFLGQTNPVHKMIGLHPDNEERMAAIYYTINDLVLSLIARYRLPRSNGTRYCGPWFDDNVTVHSARTNGRFHRVSLCVKILGYVEATRV